jgi:hypothetical protein
MRIPRPMRPRRAGRITFALPLASACALLALPRFAAATPLFLGPSPYLQKSDSPFLGDVNAGRSVLEDFEDGVLNTPGVSASTGLPIAAGGNTDSVDGDDGAIDGSGLGGHSFFEGNGPVGITFTFSPISGKLPTEAGIVWTDGGAGCDVTLEAFGLGNVSLGTRTGTAVGDGSNGGTTAEDRFFGVVDAGGITAIKISNSSGGIEVDHLQYGVPEPTSLMALLGSPLLLLRRRAPRRG